jgi:hypothetical protein
MIRLLAVAALVLPCIGCASVTRGTTRKYFDFVDATGRDRRIIRAR